MGLYVVSRRQVVYEQVDGASNLVVFIPGTDQVQVLKDAAGTSLKSAAAAAQNPGVKTRGPQLSRVSGGQRTVYGHLPPRILDLRQQVRVFLAEDLAPAQADAFFFVFSPSVVVHGVRERNDDGKLSWRTAQLQFKGEDPLLTLQEALADFALANPGQQVVLAVADDLELYRRLQQLAQPFGFAVVPFSTLKPAAGVVPLYRHGNYTWLYLGFMVLGAAAMVGVAGYWVIVRQHHVSLKNQIDAVENQIRAMQVNPQVGHIRQPEVALAILGERLATSPSAVIDAGARFAREFGDLRELVLSRQTVLPPGAALPAGPETMLMETRVINARDLLLLEQQQRSEGLQREHPWVRHVFRVGQVGASTDLVLVLQAQADPNAAVSPTGPVPILADVTPTEPTP